MGVHEEIGVKLHRVRRYLEEHQMAAMALTLQSNFAWLSGGGENRVYSATDTGAATLLVTPDSAYLLASNIEAPRLEAEELAGKGFTTVSFPWLEEGGLRKAMDRIVGSGQIAADSTLPGTHRRDADIARLRYSLTPEEIERYRWLAMGTAYAVQDACRGAEPGMTEHILAAETGGALMANGIQPALVLVATDERIAKYRHPLPTEQKLVRMALVSAAGRRWGLVTCVTRLVHFGPLSADLARRHDAVCRVDATMITKTRPGTAVREIFQAALEAYAEYGFTEEWRNHHQGGATGYSARDYRATPHSDEVVQQNQAFAWNPTITGTKSEDTLLATEEGPEVLSTNNDWPMRLVSNPAGTIARPDILVL